MVLKMVYLAENGKINQNFFLIFQVDQMATCQMGTH